MLVTGSASITEANDNVSSRVVLTPISDHGSRRQVAAVSTIRIWGTAAPSEGDDTVSAVTYRMRVKYWTGSQWKAGMLKYWSGSAWVKKPIKFRTGTGWMG